MRGKTKPAHPRGKARASETVVAGRRDTQETISTRTIRQQDGEVAVYDGLTCTGWLQPKNGGWLAFTAEGKFLGSHASDRIAARAVYQGRRP